MERLPKKKRKITTWLTYFLAFLFFMFLSQLPMTIATIPSVAKHYLTQFPNLASLITQVTFFIYGLALCVSLVLLYVFIRFYQKEKKKGQVTFYSIKEFAPNFKMYFFYGLIAQVFLLILENILAHFQVKEATNQIVLEQLFHQAPLLMTFFIAIFAPITEEILYRGFFFRAFFDTENQKMMYLGIFLNGLFFAFLHEATFSLQSLPYFLMGVVFALCFRKTKDIKTSIALHMLNNSLGVLSILLS